MDLIRRIVGRIKRDYYRWSYGLAARKILDTVPLESGGLNFLLLSMVHKRDVISYLVAIKSFARYVNPQRIVVVCDPSIDNHDRAVIKSQIPHVEFRSAEEFTHPKVPRGGCWERLFAITEYNLDNYVVQLDADTVTLGELGAVESAIRGGYGFVLGEVPNQGLLSFKQASDLAKKIIKPDAHIQTRSEFALPGIGLSEDLKYVRGCAGFTGFPPSTDMRDQLLDFSEKMSVSVGQGEWKTWGTEQVTSNYLVANREGTIVLPFPEYGTPNKLSQSTVFLHFIGSLRFINRMYQNATTKVIGYIDNK